MFRYVLFDLDGTLTDSKPGIFWAIKKVLKLRGKEFSDEVLLQFLGPPMEESIVTIAGFSQAEAKLVKKDFLTFYKAAGIYDNTLIRGIPKLLGMLKDKGIKLAVATSKPEFATLKVLDRFSLLGFFDVISAAPNDGDGKKSEVVRRALEMLRVDKTEKRFAVMVGDRKYDVIGAKENGIASVGFTAAGYAEEGELEAAGADFITDNVTELARFLLGDNE